MEITSRQRIILGGSVAFVVIAVMIMGVLFLRKRATQGLDMEINITGSMEATSRTSSTSETITASSTESSSTAVASTSGTVVYIVPPKKAAPIRIKPSELSLTVTTTDNGTDQTTSTSAAQPAVDPLVDSDGDGLTDQDEIQKYHTDPQRADTDGDTYPDGEEIKKGYNPLGPGKCAQPSCILSP